MPDLNGMIQALCELEDGLSDWEMDFVESVANQEYEYRLSVEFLKEKDWQ